MALEARAQGLRGILDHRNAAAPGHFQQSLHVRALAKQVDRHDGLDALRSMIETAVIVQERVFAADVGGYLLDGEVVASRVDVYEDWFGA